MKWSPWITIAHTIGNHWFRLLTFLLSLVKRNIVFDNWFLLLCEWDRSLWKLFSRSTFITENFFHLITYYSPASSYNLLQSQSSLIPLKYWEKLSLSITSPTVSPNSKNHPPISSSTVYAFQAVFNYPPMWSHREQTKIAWPTMMQTRDSLTNDQRQHQGCTRTSSDH